MKNVTVSKQGNIQIIIIIIICQMEMFRANIFVFIIGFYVVNVIFNRVAVL